MKKFITMSLVLLMSIAVMFGVMGCDNATDDDPTGTMKYSVYAPDGAPAMAIAKMMKDKAFDYEYTIINATNVAAHFTAADADFIIAPTNAGVKLSVATDKYMIAAVTSWGNLYLVGDKTAYSPRSSFDSAAEFLAQFSGKTIASIGTGAVPDVTLKHLLSNSSVSAEITASDAQNIQASLADNTGAIKAAVLGEPAVTATLSKVQSVARLANISELWAEITGQDFPQAALFVKKSIIESHKADVDAFLTKLDESISYLNESQQNAKELGEYMESLETSTLKGAIVAKCYPEMQQKYITAENAKSAILPFVTVLGVNITAEKLDSIIYKG